MSEFGNIVRPSDPAGVEDAAARQTERVEDSRPTRWLMRAGSVARGITYGVIGALALAITLEAGTGGAAPDQQGAPALIARSPLGSTTLVVICAGLLAYEVWKLTQAIAGRGPEGGGGAKPMGRVSNAAGGLVYLGFFAVAVSALSGRSGNSSGQARRAAVGVLGCHPPRSPTRCTSRAAPSTPHYPPRRRHHGGIRRQRLERARAMLLA